MVSTQNCSVSASGTTPICSEAWKGHRPKNWESLACRWDNTDLTKFEDNWELIIKRLKSDKADLRTWRLIGVAMSAWSTSRNIVEPWDGPAWPVAEVFGSAGSLPATWSSRSFVRLSDAQGSRLHVISGAGHTKEEAGGPRALSDDKDGRRVRLSSRGTGKRPIAGHESRQYCRDCRKTRLVISPYPPVGNPRCPKCGGENLTYSGITDDDGVLVPEVWTRILEGQPAFDHVVAPSVDGTEPPKPGDGRIPVDARTAATMVKTVSVVHGQPWRTQSGHGTRTSKAMNPSGNGGWVLD